MQRQQHQASSQRGGRGGFRGGRGGAEVKPGRSIYSALERQQTVSEQQSKLSKYGY